MLNTVLAIVKDGKIELPESVLLPDGTKVLITLLQSDQESTFWQSVSESSLKEIWDNSEDDIYEQLL
ncbi:hypothetical protein C7H19_13170 [Aphanothece hegewaldii CCALA 016]|uniref:Uncharacterized protein n=1 Tax=Aphanothece hegewaldii CCALA 016 TaxID=2107694 RepID=A0A2T1LWU0_9CHRO|nr:hypothetical protein [Aphanothece hegewaldii]PSF36626.1 hypothetical protein C7H19_13170 [Aphanothece hegewaldii CCALA 016]